MRTLVIDFDLTVLWPLIFVALVSLWNSTRSYRESSAYCKASVIRLKGAFDTKEEGEKWLESGRKHHNEKQQARNIALSSLTALLLLSSMMLISDRWKLHIAYHVWGALYFFGIITFITAIGMACHYARNPLEKWQGIVGLKLWVCLLVMLLAAASTEHFFHQKMNVRHIGCPTCSDDDDSSDDN